MTANIPDFRLSLGGDDLRGEIFGAVAQLLDITGKVRPRLISLSLSEKRGEEADQLDITLDDSDGGLALPKAGAIMHLELGWIGGRDVTPGLVSKGRYKVVDVEHSGPPDQVRITARAADFAGDLKRRREQSWHDTTLGAIIAEIAARNSLSARVSASLGAIAVPTLVQSRESDMALLRRLGREHDATATIKAGALIFAPIGAGATATGKALPAVQLTRGAGDRHNFKLTGREDGGGATASWHDRKSARKHKVTVGQAKGAKILSRTYASEEAARAAATAAQRKTARQPASFDYTLAFGRADLFPELKVTVAGFKPEIDGTAWLIQEATHSLTDRGFTTALKLERS